jgi:DNA-directed RNA polymerase specialized sigma24 family protein
MSLAALAERCQRELNRYSSEEACDERYCLELLRRATVQGDPASWACVQQLFSGLVRRWLRRHPGLETAARLDSEENYLALAFERFWQATTQHQRLDFRTVAAALQYLRASLHGVILDTLRAYAQRREVALPEPDAPGEPFVEDHDAAEGSEMWDLLTRLLPEAREQRLAYLLFHCGLKPREVVRFCSSEFGDVHEVYRLRRSIIERLRRQAPLIRMTMEEAGIMP